jgi:hypothetical protein
MTTSSCSIRSLSNPKIAFQGQMPIQSQSNRRKYPREPASFFVSCQQADLTRVEPKTLNVHKWKGQVVWRQFHGDSSVQEETLFTAGIKFLNLNDPF